MVVSDVALTSADEVSTTGVLRGGRAGASCVLPSQTSSLETCCRHKRRVTWQHVRHRWWLDLLVIDGADSFPLLGAQ